MSVRLPRFRDLHQGPVYDVAQILDEIRSADKRIIDIDLADLKAEAEGMRGCYETTRPTLAGWLTVSMGDSCTRWIDRAPDFEKAFRPMQELVNLYEVTPVVDGDSLLIYRWQIRVREEAERRRQWLIRLAGKSSTKAAQMRMEAAG